MNNTKLHSAQGHKTIEELFFLNTSITNPKNKRSYTDGMGVSRLW